MGVHAENLLESLHLIILYALMKNYTATDNSSFKLIMTTDEYTYHGCNFSPMDHTVS